MDKVDYVDKMYTLLSDGNTYEKLVSNPLERVNAEFHKKIRQLFGTNQEMIKKFRSSNSKLPYLYGTVKTHKDGNPLRPIISTVGTVSYDLSKFLVHLLQPIVGTISDSHIKNSAHFVDIMNTRSTNYNDVMISFDVKSLFTCVPVCDILEFLKNELSKYVLSLPVCVILDLIRLCVVDTCFTFNGDFYRQKFGMQMGNCLSPVLSNIYMEYYETRIANSVLPDDIFWVRYVDDIFAVIKLEEDIEGLLTNLNDLVPSISFTVEKEENKSISFLDVTIIRHENCFKFKVYRKPTNNNHIINAYSYHSDLVKKSSLRSMFLRALNICSPEYYDEEINNIYSIGHANNFKTCEIDTCLNLAKKSFYIKKDKPKNENYISFPYHPSLENIVYPFRLLGFNVSFSYPLTIGRTLIRNSPKHEDGAVYMIPCGCNKIYIGQSGKPLEKRIAQHQYNVARDDPSSAINSHSRNCNIPIDWKNTKKIFSRPNFTERNIIETACISHTKDINFNTSPGIYKLDPIVLHIFKQQYRLSEILSL